MSRRSVETLSLSGIQEIDYAIDAQATVQAIGIWAQIPYSEQKIFFSGDRSPLKHDLIPIDLELRKRFYSKLSRAAVTKWKRDPHNPDLKGLASSVIEDCVRDLFLPQINSVILKNNGHLVDQHGISKGVSKKYLQTLNKLVELSAVETSIHELPAEIGGLTIDMLDQAQRNLQLTAETDSLINSFYLYRRRSGFTTRLLARLRSAQAVRKYYLDAGLDLNSLMSLWGINSTFQETKDTLKSLLKDKSRQDKVLAAVAELHPNDHTVTESEAYFSRARHLNLPTRLPNWDEISVCNSNILEKISRTMHFSTITNQTPQSQLIFTGKPGARTRGVNASYLNDRNMLINIPLVYGYAPETQKVKTISHELTHALHIYLVTKLFGYDAWIKIGRGVKELFAKLVEESVIESSGESATIPDHLRPAIVDWFQPIYGYAQLRLIEEISATSRDLSDVELLATEAKITNEILPFYTISNQGLTFDSSQLRRTPFDSQTPSDGIVYVISEINSKQIPTSNPKEFSHASISKQLFVQRWGERWINNTEAYELLLAAMIMSHNLPDTNSVHAFMQTLFETDSDAPKRILSNHNIVLNNK